MELIAAVDAWLASLHPAMGDVSSVQLLSVLVLSWLGCRAICGPADGGEPPEKTPAEVREILRRARRRQ